MGALLPKPQEATENEPGFGQFYSVGKEIGYGGSSLVYECYHKATWTKAAVKFIERSHMPQEDQEAVMREVEILSQIDHPNIVQLYDFFKDKKRFYIVMELCEGGELLRRIMRKGKGAIQGYSEKEARDIVRVLFDTIAYLHQREICHRDIKPENLLLEHKGLAPRVKLADFGCARVMPRNMRGLREWCGTPSYMAPEMVQGGPYGKPVDIWSAGVVTFILLGGYHPFYSPSVPVMFHLIKTGDYGFRGPMWASVSEDAKDLVRRLLVVDPRRRLTAQDALRHPWIRTHDHILRSRSLEAGLKDMISRRERRRFRALVYAVIAARTFVRLGEKARTARLQTHRQQMEGLKRPPVDKRLTDKDRLDDQMLGMYRVEVQAPGSRTGERSV